MASSLDYVEFVCEQIKDDWSIRYKKMFGEYMIYLNDKPVLLVCDNTVFVKKIDEISHLMKDAATDFPYNGAKEHYILDVENKELTNQVLKILEEVTPLPKKKYR